MQTLIMKGKIKNEKGKKKSLKFESDNQNFSEKVQKFMFIWTEHQQRPTYVEYKKQNYEWLKTISRGVTKFVDMEVDDCASTDVLTTMSSIYHRYTLKP